MNEIIAIPGKDFGNFQLSYELAESTDFADLEFINENYVAILRFSAPGISVSIVLTADQLRYWFECLELSTANGGVNMQTLPIICPKREDEHLDVITVGNELSFAGGTMVIYINLADCLKEFTNWVSSIWRELEEKEEGSL